MKSYTDTTINNAPDGAYWAKIQDNSGALGPWHIIDLYHLMPDMIQIHVHDTWSFIVDEDAPLFELCGPIPNPDELLKENCNED